MSDRDAFREAQKERRSFGKAKQHEKRLEAATYTASEVKVLTETATKVALELGRREAQAEIAAMLEDRAYQRSMRGTAVGVALLGLVGTIRSMASQPAEGASDATSGVPGPPEASEAVRSPQEPPKLVCRRCFGYGIVTEHGMSTPCPDCARTRCADCGLIDDHKGGCPQTGEAPRPGAPS